MCERESGRRTVTRWRVLVGVIKIHCVVLLAIRRFKLCTQHSHGRHSQFADTTSSPRGEYWRLQVGVCLFVCVCGVCGVCGCVVCGCVRAGDSGGLRVCVRVCVWCVVWVPAAAPARNFATISSRFGSGHTFVQSVGIDIALEDELGWRPAAVAVRLLWCNARQSHRLQITAALQRPTKKSSTGEEHRRQRRRGGRRRERKTRYCRHRRRRRRQRQRGVRGARGVQRPLGAVLVRLYASGVHRQCEDTDLARRRRHR